MPGDSVAAAAVVMVGSHTLQQHHLSLGGELCNAAAQHSSTAPNVFGVLGL